MIKSIHISNYALIDRVDLELSPGLNIVTGTTGAGKSIMLGALSLLLGGKADKRVVADPERKSIVEAVVEGCASEEVNRLVEASGAELNADGSVILRREIAPSGRGRAFINDTPVAVAALSTLGPRLIDIHSQHQNLLLGNPDFQLDVLDSMAGNEDLLNRYSEAFNQFPAARAAFAKTRRRLDALRQSEPRLREELRIIEALNLRPGEIEALEKARTRAANYRQIKEALGAIADELQNKEGSALDAVGRAAEAAAEIAEMVDGGQELSSRLSSALIELQDIAATYDNIDDRLGDDTLSEAQIDKRLNVIYRLQKKYSVNTEEEILAVAEKIDHSLASIEEADNKLAVLRDKALRERETAAGLADELTKRRKEAAANFVAELQDKAAPLGMQNIKAKVEIEPLKDLTAKGRDRVEMLFAFNLNQAPLPIGQTASGGEISRLMLCVKTILADRMSLPTVVFDEIDTGVSGEIAHRMGAMMLDISKAVQVVAITHLPQVAAKGDVHFKVFKVDEAERTTTRLRRLEADERVEEIAAMLSGEAVDEASLANARSLLNSK